MLTGLNIQQNVPLAPLTTFRVGGPAKYFCEVSNEKELREALEYAEGNKLAVFVMGGGSNILVSDNGFDGLVIKLRVESKKIKVANQNSKLTVECWAGDSLASLVNFCRDNNLTGLEWAAGIPGSIGGAVRGNAGAYGNEIKDNIDYVAVLDLSDRLAYFDGKTQNSKIFAKGESASGRKTQNCNSELKNFTKDDCKFSYRNSIFKQNPNLIIVSGVLRLEKGDKVEIENKMKEIIAKRTEKIPKDPSPGSFFKNPVVEDEKLIGKFEHDTGCQCRDSKIPAGWLIDEVGLRGKSVGGAAVSDKHGNFVINRDSAKAEDIIMLASMIKMKVRDQLGVQLVEEIQYVGF